MDVSYHGWHGQVVGLGPGGARDVAVPEARRGVNEPPVAAEGDAMLCCAAVSNTAVKCGQYSKPNLLSQGYPVAWQPMMGAVGSSEN